MASGRGRGLGAGGALTALGLAVLILGAGAATAVAQTSSAAERRVLDRAERLRDSGRADEARRALRDHLGGSPGSLEALSLLGILALEAGRPEEFLVFAEAAVGAAPQEPAARAAWVRALCGSGLLDSALAVTRRWVAEAPGEARARLAIADVRLALGDTIGAIQSLEETPEPPAEVLARRADLDLARGAGDGAVAAWTGLLGLDPPATGEVAADLRRTSSARQALMERLVAALDGAALSARRAGSLVALKVGDAGSARSLADDARGAGAVDDAAFLRDYAREAEDASLHAEVAWAARLLVGLSPRPADRLRWQTIAADRSLAAGDTGSARRAFADLSRQSPPGEATHQLASQRLFEILAADPGSLREAALLLDRYAAEYPDSTRAVAALRGALAMGHARAGSLAEAEAVILRARTHAPPDGAGPLDAAAAWLSLYAGDRDSARARAGRGVAEEGLEAGERTRRLQLLTLVQVADSGELRIVGSAAHRLLGDPEAYTAGPTLAALDAQPASPGRPTALAYLADAAEEAGGAEAAVALRRRLIDRHPDSAEAPEALLDLARAAAPEEAAGWLERLIVGYPESALAPVARRLLTELEGRP